MSNIEIELPKWFDLHTHFRQGANVSAYISDHLSTACAGALAMPNTLPPVARVSGPNQDDSWSIESYREMLIEAGADQFEELIVPLYLSGMTTVEDIEAGAKSGLLRAAKYYPPHGTTNSAHGVPMEQWLGSDVFRALEDSGVILCLHGEQHGLAGAEYFDESATAESRFYQEWMPRLRESHPNLRLVCEHITTHEAVDFVRESPADRVAATITPQHLLYTVGHLIQGLRYHLYCLPIVKFDADRQALRTAVVAEGQSQFFAGTDSAPHTTKATECGCAAGCYTGSCAPQLYAMAFEEAGVDLSEESGQAKLRRFLSENGPRYYGFSPSAEKFRLVKSSAPAEIDETVAPEGTVKPLPLGMGLEVTWSLV